MMAAGQAQVSTRPNLFYIYGGLPCNSLMADSWSDRTPLHEAAYQGRLLHLKTLITQGFHVDTLTMDRVSPLHEACLGGHYACAKFLLDNGANAEAVSADGATALFNSCSSGSAACVRLLLQHGASIRTTCQLASPIHEAARKDHRECLELLLSCGAPVDVELPDVGTPLYSACRARAAACVELLLRSDGFFHSSFEPLVFPVLVTCPGCALLEIDTSYPVTREEKAGADVHLGCGQDSPLHAAARGGESDVVELLLDFGADRSGRNADEKTPLELSTPDSAVRFALQKTGPSSLSQLCRFCVRRSIGWNRLHKASSLFLPLIIKDFLLYQ